MNFYRTLRFSLIIPAYNEERYLPKLLESVKKAKEKYKKGSSLIEIIVSDNCSTDLTREIAEKAGCIVSSIEKRCIAAVRNAGARIARGEILAFIDADSIIHENTFNVIESAISSGKYIGGATGVSLERMSTGIAITFAFMYFMVMTTGIDTGVVFCKREDFDAIGGYDENRRIGEDVNFLLRLKKLGKRKKQALVRLLSVKAITSTRKFDIHGDWHYIPNIFIFLYGVIFSKERIERLAKKYWYNN